MVVGVRAASFTCEVVRCRSLIWWAERLRLLVVEVEVEVVLRLEELRVLRGECERVGESSCGWCCGGGRYGR
jgi:hypothetical protein